MSRRGNAYVMLVASLPDLGELFRETQTPMSRYRLNERLTLLHPADATLLEAIERVLQWSHLPMGRRDDAFIRMARELLDTIDDPVLADIVRFRLELRTIVAALRLRARGEGPPASDWGFGDSVAVIRRRWDEESFGLAGVHRWLPEAARLLVAEDSLGLERLLLTLAWQHHVRAQLGHYFDFVAVVIYVLKWNMVARWGRLDARGARDRFERLVRSGLGTHTPCSTPVSTTSRERTA